ncbi:MAG TPA: YggS family pyridoxal phosphate-dependent enzyme, partial [Polyangiales bacterium]|nr:YggS family pyridoxal phosphate-dependent enzyme [Polyangiales bacterium]
MSDWDVAAAWAAVRARIAAACARVDRSPADVELLAVSKFHEPSAIRRAYEAGQRAFGENYVQELADKAQVLSDLPELHWSLIGRLHRNKA